MPQVKPLRSPCYLNKSHPHAKGLVACYVMNDSGNTVFDFSRNKNDMLLYGGASWAANGLKCDSTGEYAEFDNTDQSIVNSDEGTILMRIKSYVSFSDSQAHALLHGLSVGGKNFYILKFPSNSMSFLIDNGPTARFVNIAEPDNWTNGITIGFHWDKNKDIYDNKKMAISIDGEFSPLRTSSNADALDTFTTPATFTFLNQTAALSLYFNGECNFAYFYKKNINIKTVKNMHQNPYAMFYHPNILSNLMGAFSGSGLVQQRNKIFGANAFPQGLGL